LTLTEFSWGLGSELSWICFFIFDEYFKTKINDDLPYYFIQLLPARSPVTYILILRVICQIVIHVIKK